MTPRPSRAMVLAAGLGLRLRPLTENLPKPLIELARRTMLDRALDALAGAAVAEAVVNTHYLGHMIADHLSRHVAGEATPRVVLSPESTLLETGGGVANALPGLGADPFYVVNADIAWRDGATPALQRLADSWHDGDMDALLLLHPVADAVGFDGAGDYILDGDGRITRRHNRPSAPFVFTGVQLLHPRLFTGAPSGAFSLIRLFDQAEAACRLFGLVHDSAWFHVGTPNGLALAETALNQVQGV